MTRFNSKDSGVKSHQKGDIFEYEFPQTIESTDENDSHGLFVIDLHDKNRGVYVVGVDLHLTHFDGLKIMDSLGEALKIKAEDYQALARMQVLKQNPFLKPFLGGVTSVTMEEMKGKEEDSLVNRLADLFNSLGELKE